MESQPQPMIMIRYQSGQKKQKKHAGPDLTKNSTAPTTRTTSATRTTVPVHLPYLQAASCKRRQQIMLWPPRHDSPTVSDTVEENPTKCLIHSTTSFLNFNFVARFPHPAGDE
jgi:hypothetical protein